MKYDPDCNTYHEPDYVFGLPIKGDATALDQLFSSCMPQLQRTAARLLVDPQDSEDALQGGLLSAFRHLKQFQGRAQFASWMHAIMVNAAKSKLRKQSSQPLISSLDELLHGQDDLRLADTLADTGPNLDEEYVQIEGSRILGGILQKLPSTLRAVISLCYMEGLRIKEAAEKLGAGVSAMKTWHPRANRLILNVVRERRTR